MTSTQYKAAIKKLGLTIVGARHLFGLSPRQAQRLASGETPVPKLVEKVLRLIAAGKLTKEDLLP